MLNWEKTLVSSNATLLEVLNCIDSAASQMAIVVDHNKKLIGTITDGDIRRGILRGGNLKTKVSEVMEKNPTFVTGEDDRLEIFSIMRKKSLHQIPIVNESGIVIGLEIIDDILSFKKCSENCVIIMAGGLGRRLKKLTRDKPKPMLQVGPRPLLETIILNFASQGFNKFYITVNYKSNQIKDYFGNGSNIGVNIEYISEKIKLGTAGALSLIPHKPTTPVLVTNADVLTNQDYKVIINNHAYTNADATMCVRNYDFKFPFGVVNEEDNIIKSIDEKPTLKKIISSGIYVFSPIVFNLVEKNKYLDMPELFNRIVQNGMLARTQNIDGYWIDVGRADDLNKANQEILEVFK